jgi:hypothetical protein
MTNESSSYLSFSRFAFGFPHRLMTKWLKPLSGLKINGSPTPASVFFSLHISYLNI